MLRRLQLKSEWRSLNTDSWPDDVPFGSRTVVYGHNGSGKSTLAELFLSLAEGSAEANVVWHHADRTRTIVRAGGAGPSPAMAVFTRKWVEANLSEFLDGENADAIVTLGKKAIDSKEAEKDLKAKINQLSVEAQEAEELHAMARQSLDRLVREVQDSIIHQLQEFDHGHYTRNRYSVVKVKELLRVRRTWFPDSLEAGEALSQLAQGMPRVITDVTGAPRSLANELEPITAILARKPTRMAIAALEADASAQAWVEEGVDLHSERERCLFCDGVFNAERREKLARHFDESWLEIRSTAQQLLTTVESRRLEMEAWFATLPDAALLVGDVQAAYQRAVEEARRRVDEQVEALGQVEAALAVKVKEPSATPEVPVWPPLATTVSSAALTEAVGAHNSQAQRHGELTAEREQVVLDHIIGSQSEAFYDLVELTEQYEDASKASSSAVHAAQQKLDRVREQRFTSIEMADALTQDLARVYGKGHLRIAATSDGKSYVCRRRGDEAGRNLSEGERTTLSLLYFLRNLEHQQNHETKRSRRIVVIDDPSSSLDREALFATHQWLFSTLQGFGQYIVLTHDFNLLKLFIGSHRNKWNASVKAISAADRDEANFPRVAFLEMFAAAESGGRVTRLEPLPDLLRNSTSEYAYLFSMIMKSLGDGEDPERLLLLPNAARRVLEVFASYKAPHRPNFLQQLEVLVKEEPGEPYRDVYDFCNRYSHGEGAETVEVLDARAVQGQIRRSMEFLRAIDSEHFHNMCKAVKIDPKVLA